MPDKLDAGPYWGNSNLPPSKGTVDDLVNRYIAVCAERDELRAEVERLTEELRIVRAVLNEKVDEVERYARNRA